MDHDFGFIIDNYDSSGENVPTVCALAISAFVPIDLLY